MNITARIDEHRLSQLDKHRAWKAALYPVALAFVRRGGWNNTFPEAPAVTEEAHASGIAHIAASDMVMRGKTRMLPMLDVLAVDPFAIQYAEAAE